MKALHIAMLVLGWMLVLWILRPKHKPFVNSFDIITMLVLGNRKSGKGKTL